MVRKTGMPWAYAQSVCGDDSFYPGAVGTEPPPDGPVRFRPTDQEAAIGTVEDGPPVTRSYEDEILGEGWCVPSP